MEAASRYQQLQLDASSAPPSSCNGALQQYFTHLNAPVNTPD